jgi:predicted nucleotidyltransferase
MEITKEKILHCLAELKPTLKPYGIEELALFGSFATNEQNVYSDIDIAIKKEKDFLKNHSPYDYFELMNNIKVMIRKKLHRNSDIFDLDSNSSFKDSIKKELIYV